MRNSNKTSALFILLVAQGWHRGLPLKEHDKMLNNGCFKMCRSSGNTINEGVHGAASRTNIGSAHTSERSHWEGNIEAVRTEPLDEFTLDEFTA